MSMTEATGQRGAGGGRGQNGGCHSGGAAQGHQPARPRTSAFRGSTSKMNGNVFQCSEEQNNRMQFKNTKDALQEYVKNTSNMQRTWCLYLCSPWIHQN